MGRVGVSMATNSALNVFRNVSSRQEMSLEKMLKNVERVVNTLGQLKGVPMKLGQMLSLHEGLLPEEVVQVLSKLQRDAPPATFESIKNQLQTELKDAYEQIETLEEKPYASASIGQVHRARLKDGRDVVFKIQYPGIDKVIAADMKNMRGMLSMIFSIFTSADMDTVWEEMNERLLEELDYEMEGRNIQAMREFMKDNLDVVVPDYIQEVSSRRVICMAFEEGIPPDRACSDEFPQDLKDRWASTLFETFMMGLFKHRFLHADPNFSNFAFLEDGRLIMYDFGCIKKVPLSIAQGYAALVRAVFEDRMDDVPEILRTKMNIHNKDGKTVPLDVVRNVGKILKQPFRKSPEYRFGAEGNIYDDILDHGKTYWMDSMQLVFPADIVFIDRTISGHMGNLIKLKAAGPWRELLEKFIYDESVS